MATMADTMSTVRTESSSVASTVSITDAAAAFDWDGNKDARYWLRPTLAPTNRSAIDTARPDAAWTRPFLRSRARTTETAKRSTDMMGSTRAMLLRNFTQRCSFSSCLDWKSTNGAPVYCGALLKMLKPWADSCFLAAASTWDRSTVT